MGGMYNGNDDGESSIWWNNLTTSIDTIKINHKNVDTFFIDGEGHCTLGLYYGLQVEGFEDWAENISKMTSSPSSCSDSVVITRDWVVTCLVTHVKFVITNYE